MIDRPLDSTSTKMNASTPTENIASATRVAGAEQLEPPDREPEVDREAGERAEQDCLSEGHVVRLGGPNWPERGNLPLRGP